MCKDFRWPALQPFKVCNFIHTSSISQTAKRTTPAITKVLIYTQHDKGDIRRRIEIVQLQPKEKSRNHSLRKTEKDDGSQAQCSRQLLQVMTLQDIKCQYPEQQFKALSNVQRFLMTCIAAFQGFRLYPCAFHQQYCKKNNTFN